MFIIYFCLNILDRKIDPPNWVLLLGLVCLLEIKHSHTNIMPYSNSFYLFHFSKKLFATMFTVLFWYCKEWEIELTYLEFSWDRDTFLPGLSIVYVWTQASTGQIHTETEKTSYNGIPRPIHLQSFISHIMYTLVLHCRIQIIFTTKADNQLAMA